MTGLFSAYQNLRPSSSSSKMGSNDTARPPATMGIDVKDFGAPDLSDVKDFGASNLSEEKVRLLDEAYQAQATRSEERMRIDNKDFSVFDLSKEEIRLLVDTATTGTPAKICIDDKCFGASELSEEELRLLVEAAAIHQRSLPLSEALRLAIRVVQKTSIHRKIRMMAVSCVLQGMQDHNGGTCSLGEEHLQLVSEYQQALGDPAYRMKKYLTDAVPCMVCGHDLV
jgi:hypothetical protein